MNWRVYTKAAAHSQWSYTGIIESNKPAAEKIWAEIVRNLRYHAFKLEGTTGGIPIQRPIRR